MSRTDEPKQTRPVDADAERTEDEAKRRVGTAPKDGGKPDEGIHPDQLTSENDGGSQG